MPTPAIVLLIAVLLPLVSACALLFAGRRMGDPLAGWVATVAIGLSFGLSIGGLLSWAHGGSMFVASSTGDMPVLWGYGQGPIHLPIRWLPIGACGVIPANVDHPGWLDVGLYIDSLTVAMFAMITLVGAIVHVFSIGYMRGDPRFSRYFAYLGLFCFSMLGLCIGGTLLHIFIFWELVGFCSYLLIGFWYEKRTARNAAIKAFIVNRIGDMGFIIGLGLLVCYVGNATLPDLWMKLGSASFGGPVTLPDGTIVPAATITLIGIALFCGAIGKSAQFPLHVWLPDAMEGPTPISALIHAATMVAAGVYLVGRIFPILTPSARLFIAIIGLVTLVVGALIATVQSDIKRLLAFSTMSQLGYMMLAMGMGSWVGGLFHLMTHAFFKSLLFLAAGSVIVATGHERELPRMGGLWRKIPWTAACFAVAVLAIAGTPQFSGCYSKEMILCHAGAFATLAAGRAGASAAYWIFFVVPTLMAYLTAFYMARCWMLAFWGQPRDEAVFEKANESPILWSPLVVLALLSTIAGNWLSIPELLQGAVRESTIICQRLGEDASACVSGGAHVRFAVFATAWPGRVPAGGERGADEPTDTEPVTQADLTESQRAHKRGDDLVSRYVSPAWWVGILLAFVVYLRGYAVARRMGRVPPIRWIYNWLYGRMYFDELYFALLVATIGALSRLAGWFDRTIVDGLVNLSARTVRGAAQLAGLSDRRVVDRTVDGVVDLALGLGVVARSTQTGRLRYYVAALSLTITVGLAVAVVILLSIGR